MAAYAALLSLTHTIHQIQNHPRPPISLHTKHVQSLTQNLTFLQDFLENYSINGGAIKDFERLEGRIAEASYEAEDIIESHVVDQIQAANAKSVNNENKSKLTIREDNIRAVDMFHQGLEKVAQDLDLIKKDVEEIMKQIGGGQLERNYSMPAGGSRPPSGHHGSMVGLDDVLLEAMDKLLGQHSGRQILPIVGMGGIGKTILARNLYSHPTVVEHFYLRGWATISQQYDSKEILLEVLACLEDKESREMLSKMKEHEIGDILYKTLYGQKYLIVMDDLWSVRAWEKVKFFFPDNNNGSRIVITTRLSDLAFELSGSRGLEMGFLNEDNSWKLFRKSVFGEKDCPPELEEIGKKISNNCKGLPLSIVVTGGLLAMPAGGPPRPLSGPHGSMVGLDDVLLEAMDKLTRQHPAARQILPIVGMGGIGKTILARNLYSHPTVVEHFYLRGWATISQQYDSKDILLEVLVYLKGKESREMLSNMKEHEIGEILYKTLCGQKYLIVMDDVWSVRAWDKVKFFFPDNNNGSRIVITTRLSDLAFELSGSRGLEMGFLDEDNSWNLFRKSVFGEKDCPMELEEIGKKITKNCKGLPLSIVVTGGLLAMSVQTRKHWQYIAENLNSVVNLNDNERCLRILRLSYNHLPVHLKPCFIYMGIFPEDHLVSASTLVKLWVAEGFLKPIRDKTLEAAAEEYLKDLVQRNLILVQELGHHGDVKRFRIHDLLRDLCMKEAEKDRFFCVAATDRPNAEQIWHTQRRIGIQRREGSSKHIPRAVRNAIRCATLARSLICSADKLRRCPSRLLKVFHRIEVFIPEYTYSLKDIFRPVNSRHIVAAARLSRPDRFPSSFYHLWNLQTLIIDLEVRNVSSAPPVIDIWRMPRLRHVNLFTFHLPEPPTGRDDDSTVLWDLQTLKTVSTSEWGEEAVRRIPNVKKLNLMLPYTKASSRDDYRLDNLSRLRVVESLCCNFYCRKEPFIRRGHDLALSLVFPHSLRKLTLVRATLPWEDLAAKVGYLPHLEVLKLKFRSCKGLKWETVQGQFCSLKVLEIHLWPELEQWTMEDWDHFPCLERLVLDDFRDLKAIPSEIGEIPTLKWIRLINCNDSLVVSVKEMVEVQEEMGNEGLAVSVALYEKNQLVESLAAPPKFQVEVW